MKIITGIRRCGKGVLFSQIMDEIRERSENILYINFEDRRITSEIKDFRTLLDYVDGRCDKTKKFYLFFDEIQNVENWVEAVKTLRLENKSIFITGSNSKLLSGEFIKELTRRFVSFRIHPFVFRELSEYAKELGKNISWLDYIIYGGMPKRLEFERVDEQLRYIEDIENSIVYNDIISRFSIRKTEIFKRLVDFILQSNARIYSVQSIKNYISTNFEKCSLNTIAKYIDYLKQAFVINGIKEYSTKVKRELLFFEKIYNEDVSFNSIRKKEGEFDITHNLENIVYNELIYQGFDVRLFNFEGSEIDFKAMKNRKTCFIQVCYSLVEEEVRAREFKAFNLMDQSSKKIIISSDELDYSTSTVEHINIKDFLSRDLLL